MKEIKSVKLSDVTRIGLTARLIRDGAPRDFRVHIDYVGEACCFDDTKVYVNIYEFVCMRGKYMYRAGGYLDLEGVSIFDYDAYKFAIEAVTMLLNGSRPAEEVFLGELKFRSYTMQNTRRV